MRICEMVTANGARRLESFRDRGGVRVESLRPGPPGTAAAFHWFPRRGAKADFTCLDIDFLAICS